MGSAAANQPEGSPLYVEVSSLIDRAPTGVGRFVARMIEALAPLTPLRLFTTLRGDHARRMHLSTALVYGHEIDVAAGTLPVADNDLIAWTHALLARRGRRPDPAAAASSAALFPWLRPATRHFRREVSVLFDFTPILLPWSHRLETREECGRFFTETAALSDRALAISAATKADAAWLTPIPPEHVAMAYPGPSLCVGTHADPALVPRRHDVILVVSTIEPRKNGGFLLDWFTSSAVLPPSIELWWAGPEGWLSSLRDRAARTHPERIVRFLGMVPDARLCALYRQASCTIYPSLYEGFGFPVLDSLLHGTAVLASFNSSLQEFAGPGVFYFDPYDPSSLDAAYLDFRAAPPTRLDTTALRERFSWDTLARTLVSLCT